MNRWKRHISLGNHYFDKKRYAEAIEHHELAKTNSRITEKSPAKLLSHSSSGGTVKEILFLLLYFFAVASFSSGSLAHPGHDHSHIASGAIHAILGLASVLGAAAAIFTIMKFASARKAKHRSSTSKHGR